MSPFSKLKILLETRSKASRERTKVRKMKAKAEKAKSRTLAATDIAYDITTPVDDPRKLAARKYRKRHEKGGINLEGKIWVLLWRSVIMKNSFKSILI